MALIFADNAQGAFVDEPRTIVGSNLGYGKYRVFYDTIDFSDKPVDANDDIVLANLTQSATVWSLFRAWSTAVVTAGATLTLGFVNKSSGIFYPLGPDFDLTTPDIPQSWDSADIVPSNALPAVVKDTFEGEATRKGRESDAWLVFRNTGTIASGGVAKFEVPATVE